MVPLLSLRLRSALLKKTVVHFAVPHRCQGGVRAPDAQSILALLLATSSASASLCLRNGYLPNRYWLSGPWRFEYHLLRARVRERFLSTKTHDREVEIHIQGAQHHCRVHPRERPYIDTCCTEPRSQPTFAIVPASRMSEQYISEGKLSKFDRFHFRN